MSGTNYKPTLSGFLTWIRSDMQISNTDLPDNAIWITYAFNVAMEIVSPLNACASPLIYMLMVYNLGGDNLMNYAQDSLLGVPPSRYFSQYRADNNINNFIAGVATAGSDNGTSANILVSDQLKNLTIGNLQNLKTPWGVTYLSFQQRTGFIWGVT